MIKKFIYTFIVGGLGGMTIILIFSRPNSIPLLGNILSFANQQQVIERVIVEKTIEVISREELITKKINEASESIVLIQAFKGGQILRYGGGAFLTRNILVTTNNVVPSFADTFQIYTGDKIVRGRVVRRDYQNNLALIEIPETNQPLIDFSSVAMTVGEINYIVGKYINVNEVMLLAQQAIVSRIDKDFVILDSHYENDLSGSVLINKEGTMKGIVFVDGTRIQAVKSEIVKEFFESYSKEINNE